MSSERDRRQFPLSVPPAKGFGRRAVRTTKTIIILLAATLSVVVLGDRTDAAFMGLPKALKPQLERLELAMPTLAPMAHSMFCLAYPTDCQVRKIAFRGKK